MSGFTHWCDRWMTASLCIAPETRKRLSISYQECDDIRHKLVDISMTLGVCLPKLLNALDLNERLYAAIKERLSQADYE